MRIKENVNSLHACCLCHKSNDSWYTIYFIWSKDGDVTDKYFSMVNYLQLQTTYIPSPSKPSSDTDIDDMDVDQDLDEVFCDDDSDEDYVPSSLDTSDM